ncbi:biotin--[acetyl-CoA-carboxylase] ligase [Adhaeretor mobilis]|uniref:biotin--[biotin carboxyl-carrier protein] ligase n=1 Tax=Adhaeretor mobilis TaxID=1930276 RepID=A0A517MQR0_9BACT|nr:biotin--[acetyl-CoA-carboxylase] ligase [Adhaeretor mobilis]QDS97219.1 Bifunctional ligase/repressor BirA [Adhaeretor mobilis]
MNLPNSICQSDLESLLEDTFLQSAIHYAQTDSTNTQAIELLASDNSVDSPCLVVAESQVAGRGRGANQWWSASGSLTFSLIVEFPKTAFSVEQKNLLPLLTGMAILHTGETLLPDADFALKWPNDVYLAGRKLAGVLIEVPSQSSDHAVIGIGVNVNNSFSDAPEGLSSTCISLADQSGVQHSRIQILRTFMREIESLLNSAFGSTAAGETFLDDWPAYCLLTGKQVTLQIGSTQVTGICRGIDISGALILETVNGPQSFLSGVVHSWI